MTETTIPLTQDNIPDDIEGMPKPLTPEGSVVIEGEGIALPGYVKIDGVEQGGDDPAPNNQD